MLIYLTLLINCFVNCGSPNRIDQNRQIWPPGESEVIDSQTPPGTAAILSQIAPPNQSVFTKKDGILVFEGDWEVLNQRQGLIQIFDESGDVWNSINYFDDNVDSMTRQIEEFRPVFFRAGDFDLRMRCTGESDGWYRIVVQEETIPQIAKYVRTDDSMFKFKTWAKYLFSLTWVDFDQEKNPILQSPEGKEQHFEVSKNMRFIPVEIKGDWLKIRREYIGNDKRVRMNVEKSRESEFGWIRWRKDSRLLVYGYYP